MTDCLFCRIAAGEIPSDIVLETPDLVAFRDIDPKAPTHVLVIPRAHFDNIGDIAREDPALAASLLQAASDVAQLEMLDSGYRVVTNVGSDAGQSVNHVHLHVMGGRALTWPPG